MSESQSVLVVRHPQTVLNAAGCYIGRGDSPLTEVGQEQVKWLEQVAAFWQPELVVSSPLGRALDAARAVAPGGVEVRVLMDLQEVDFGQAEGRTYSELQELGIRLDYHSGGPVAPDGETGDSFAERVRRAAAAIEACACRVLVVTHGGVMRRLLVHWLELPEMAAWRFDVPNGSAAALRICQGSAVLEELSRPPGDPAVRRMPRHCKPWHMRSDGRTPT